MKDRRNSFPAAFLEMEEKQKNMDIPTRLQTLDWERYTKCARQAAADGIVLLRNEKAVLPLPEGEPAVLLQERDRLRRNGECLPCGIHS